MHNVHVQVTLFHHSKAPNANNQRNIDRKAYLSLTQFFNQNNLFMRSKFQLAVLLGVSALIYSACTTSGDESKPADMEKTKAEIQAMEDAYAAAEKAKDANAVVAYYSDDAISYGRNEPPSSGKANIKETIAKRMAKDTTGNYSVYKVVELFAQGDMLVEIGSWTSFNPAGTEVDNGHYMSYFQKRDGKYVCVRDMSASSNPAKPSV